MSPLKPLNDSQRLVLERLMHRSDPVGDCWVWGGALGSNGYGYIRYEGSSKLTHRVTYELLVGPIPAELEIDHLCRNTGCINPEHLEAVSHAENVRRGEGGRYWSRRTHCSKGHRYTDANTRLDRKGARVCRICTREYDRARNERERCR